MKKQVRLSTQTRHILLYVFSIIGGLICLLTYYVTNFLYTDNDDTIWWAMRVAVFKLGASVLALSFKTFEGLPKFNVGVNAFILICISDIIGRLRGDTETDLWDVVWVFIIIGGCIYEYRIRRLRT